MLGVRERTSDMQFTSRSLKTRLLQLLMDIGETLKSRVNTRIFGGLRPPKWTAILTKGAPPPEPPRNHHWLQLCELNMLNLYREFRVS